MNDNNEDLTQKIKEWLEKQGQSLEMRVAKTFRENGFDVSQFEHFIDPESQIVRQTDIVASISQNIENSQIAIKLIIECKYAKSKPWIILVTQQKIGKFTFFGRMLNGDHPSNWEKLPTIQGRLAGKIALALEKSREIEKFQIDPIGYAIMEAQTQDRKDPNKSDYAYEAIMQVIKSTQWQDRKNEDIFNKITESFAHEIEVESGLRTTTSSSSLGLTLSIAIPIVVIHGRLFNSYLNEKNTIEVSEIGDGFVLIPPPKGGKDINIAPLSPIMVTTESNLSTFIPKVRNLIETILQQEKAIRELIDFEESKIIPPSNSEIEF